MLAPSSSDLQEQRDYQPPLAQQPIVLIVIFAVQLLLVHHDAGAALFSTFTRALQLHTHSIMLRVARIIVTMSIVMIMILIVALLENNFSSLPPGRRNCPPISAPGLAGICPC